MSEVERALKNLNGYHEDILEALRTAASHSSHRGPPGGLGMHTPSGSSSLLSEEILRKSLLDRRSSRGGSQVGKPQDKIIKNFPNSLLPCNFSFKGKNL